MVPAAGTPDPSQYAAGYSERLWPSLGVWAALIAIPAMLGLVVLPFGPAPAIATAIAVPALVIVLVTHGTPRVAVEKGILVAGRARVPVRLLGDVEVLDAEAMRLARGARLDMRAYLCLRGWLTTGVKVELRDTEDPTPYWLISSRRPAALAAALAAATAQS